MQPPPAEVAVTMNGAAAIVVYDRPRALNALTIAMRAALAEAFPRFARDAQVYCVVQRSASPKAFSAGGDVRELIALWRQDPAAARKALADEYALNWHLECFSKPTVSLIDGMVVGSGAGITTFGTHRVAGAGYRFAMPETAIGLFPDVGIAHVLAAMPDHIGLYLGLTGRSIARADAYRLGLVTHCIDADAFDAIVAELADAEPVDPLLDRRHADPGEGALAPFRATIARCFSGATVEDIMARLAAETGPQAAWAKAAHDELATRSPLSLKMTLSHIRLAARQDLSQTLINDYRLACRCLEAHDFAEGVRAALIDKDGKPAWRPARLADVTDAMVAACFAPMPAALGGDLTLPTRAAMQALRA